MAIGHNENLKNAARVVPIVFSTPIANAIERGQTMSDVTQNDTGINAQFQINNIYLGIGATAIAFFISYIFLSK